MNSQNDEIKRYLSYFSGERNVLLGSAILLSVGAVVPALAVLFVQRTLDTVLQEKSPTQLLLMCLGFALLYLASAASTLWRTRFTKAVAWRVASRLRIEVHRKYLQMPPSQQGTIGERIASLTNEVDEVQYGVSAVVTLFRNPITLIGLGISAASMSPQMAAWTLGFLPIFIAVSRWSGSRLRQSATKARISREKLNSLAQEQILGLPVIQDFSAQAGEADRFERVSDLDREARVEQEIDRILPSLMVKTFGSFGVAVLLWVGGNQVMSGQLQTGELLAFAAALGLMLKPLSGLAEVWGLWQRSLASLERVHHVLDTEVLELKSVPRCGEGPPVIELIGVEGGYNGSRVVGPASIVVQPGEWVAIAGESGSGKTTLLGLISGRAAPMSGQVLIAGEASTQLNGDWLSVVRQEDFLFSRSVAENISLGDSAPDMNRVEAALRMAGGWEKVQSLERGALGEIGELGEELSGGERQRICLARALYRGAPVLLLDEPTNQIDPVTTLAILESLKELRGQYSILSVAHKSAAAALADQVLFIDSEGNIHSGPHKRLMRENRDYQRWCSALNDTEDERYVHSA